MRMLVAGAGALGGYFGGRLLQIGRDVTFLVRPARAQQIATHGLRIVSQHGDATLQPRTVLAGALDEPYDLVLLSLKAYALDDAMEQFAPAIGPDSAILPVLNGMRHIDSLSARFGAEKVLGGVARIAATLGPAGEVLQLMVPAHDLVYGELGGGISARVREIEAFMQGANFAPRASEQIVLEMWEKWVALATSAGMTCLMRGSVGDILNAGGQDTILAMLAECQATALAAGFAPRPAGMAAFVGMLTKPGSPLTASMLRDIEGNYPTEAEHVLGDLAERAARAGIPTPLLRIALCHLRTYAARRARETA